MRIAWFTPFSTRSAIAKYSADVVEELSKFADVDLWHPADTEEREVNVNRKRFGTAGDVETAELLGYDIVVYNLGNHSPYHQDIYLLSQRVPGLVVIHDFVMHHFFASYMIDESESPETYVKAMQMQYGSKGLHAAQNAVKRRAAGGLGNRRRSGVSLS